MVDEVLPRDAGGKGAAIRELEKSVERNAMRPVYFGDDITDEDAFLELRDRGITVLVGDRASWAQYRVAGPDEVIRALHTVLDALEGSGSS